MSVNTQQQVTTSRLMESIICGVIAGLIGGAVFGVMMATMGMLPMVGRIIGAENPVVGFVLHMGISAFIGGVYGTIVPRLPAGWPAVIVAGVIYGIIWWVLGALILMPLLLGMSQMVLVVEEMQWMSLIGHVVFGIIMAAFYELMRARA